MVSKCKTFVPFAEGINHQVPINSEKTTEEKRVEEKKKTTKDKSIEEKKRKGTYIINMCSMLLYVY